jgi:hypothetical protein
VEESQNRGGEKKKKKLSRNGEKQIVERDREKLRAKRNSQRAIDEHHFVRFK